MGNFVNPKEDDGELYTALPSSKDCGASNPAILYPKEESGSHCLLFLALKTHSIGLKYGSIIISMPYAFVLYCKWRGGPVVRLTS